jgi:hypothetical protein
MEHDVFWPMNDVFWPMNKAIKTANPPHAVIADSKIIPTREFQQAGRNLYLQAITVPRRIRLHDASRQTQPMISSATADRFLPRAQERSQRFDACSIGFSEPSEFHIAREIA